MQSPLTSDVHSAAHFFEPLHIFSGRVPKNRQGPAWELPNAAWELPNAAWELPNAAWELPIRFWDLLKVALGGL